MPENENIEELTVLKSVEKILAILVTLTVIITRFDMVKGLWLNGFLLLLCICLLCLYRKQIPRISNEIKGYSKALTVYFLCIIPSILFSGKPFVSLLMLFFFLFQYGCFAVVILFICQRKILVGMLTAFFVFSGFDCMLALIQTLFGQDLTNRGTGFGGSLLCLADIICMLLPMTLIIIMDARFETRLKNTAAFATLGVIMGLLGNKSRGAWLTELVVVPVAIYQYVKKNRKYLMAVMMVTLCVVGYMIISPQYLQRIKSITNITTDHSNADRVWTWKSAKLMIQDHPILGVGFGQFGEVYKKQYKYEQETQTLIHTHNNFIQVAVESGIVGIVGFLYLVWYFLYTSLRSYLQQTNPYDLMIFTVFLAHVCVFGQIDYTFGGIGMQPFFLFLLAILFRLKETDYHMQTTEKVMICSSVLRRPDADA